MVDLEAVPQDPIATLSFLNMEAMTEITHLVALEAATATTIGETVVEATDTLAATTETRGIASIDTLAAGATMMTEALVRGTTAAMVADQDTIIGQTPQILRSPVPLTRRGAAVARTREGLTMEAATSHPQQRPLFKTRVPQRRRSSSHRDRDQEANNEYI